MKQTPPILQCGYCGTLNTKKTKTCVQCGSRSLFEKSTDPQNTPDVEKIMNWARDVEDRIFGLKVMLWASIVMNIVLILKVFVKI